MKLITKSRSDAKSISLPSYQRKISSGMVKKIKSYMDTMDEWELPPIIINDKNEVIDGQHRLEGYKLSSASYSVPCVVMDGASKSDFILFNDTKSVSTSHKIMIHDSILRIKDIINVSVSPTTLGTINASDLAKSVFILLNRTCKTPNKSDIFLMLDTISNEQLTELSKKAIHIKDQYISTMTPNNKFRQQWFLFYSFMFSVGELTDKDIERTSNRLPNTSGGDISLIENKSTFLSVYNYRLHKKHDLSVFDRKDRL